MHKCLIFFLLDTESATTLQPGKTMAKINLGPTVKI